MNAACETGNGRFPVRCDDQNGFRFCRQAVLNAAQEIFSGLVLLFSLASHEERWATAVGDEERRHACHELNS